MRNKKKISGHQMFQSVTLTANEKSFSDMLRYGIAMRME